MKYNTINEYMGGGYMRPQMYQEGGLSRAAKNILGRSFITRGVQGAERALREEGREARKEAQRRGLLGMVGGFLGKYVAPSLLAASGLGGVGLLGSAIAKGLGAGAGRYLGEALGGATVEDSDVKSPTGFLSSSFKDIKDYREGLGEGAFGRALGTGAGTFITSGGGDYLKAVGKSKLGLPTSDKFVMTREDGELVKKMIPSVDTEAILGKAKTPELMQAFKEADLTRRDIEAKAMEARRLSDKEDYQMLKDEYASNPFKVFGDSNSGQDIQRVTSPSLIGLPRAEMVDTEAIIGAPSQNELMQAFQSADPMRENVMSKTRERALLAAQPGAISGGDDLALKRAELGDIANIERVESPSLIGEEYALERDSSNLQKQMLELERRLGAYIATEEGRLSETIPMQGIRRDSLLDFNPNISPVRYSRPMVGYDYYNRSAGLPSVSVGDLTVLGGSPRYGMNKGGLFNPMSNARRIL
tara:strand:+ start:75 stop:1493 length:1419 start_codon:yes stop_codon:yes gene_type:complete